METPQSIWTFESLLKHLEGMLAEKDVRYEQRFKAQEKNIETAYATTVKNREEDNNVRAQLQTQKGEFLPTDVANARFSAIEARLKIIEDAALKNAGKGTGSQQLWVIILAVVSLLAGLVGIAARFF